MPDAIALRGVTKTFGETVAVRDLDLVVPQGALYGVIGPNGAGKTTLDPDDPVDPDARSRGTVGAGPAVGPRGQGPDRLPARGTRPLQEDAGRPVPGLHGAAEERRRPRPEAANPAVARAGGPGGGREQTLRGALEGHAAEGPVSGRHRPPARPDHPRRAVQRPRPGEPAPAARPRVRGAPARRHRAVLDARHGARRAAVRPRRHDPPRRARCSTTRSATFARASTRGACCSSRSTRTPTCSALARCRAFGTCARTAASGISAWRPAPTRPARSVPWSQRVAPARIEVRRPTLEDVFINIVTGEAEDGEDETLRAAVREGARRGGEAMKKILRVAEREFLATAGTKAFIFAMLVTPAIIGVLIFVMPAPDERRRRRRSKGEVAIIDVDRARWRAACATTCGPSRLRAGGRTNTGGCRRPCPRRCGRRGRRIEDQTAVDEAFKKALGEVPTLDVAVLDAGADLEAAKAPLKAKPAEGQAGGGRLAAASSCTRTPWRGRRGQERRSAPTTCSCGASWTTGSSDEIKDGVRDAHRRRSGSGSRAWTGRRSTR